MQVRRIFAFTVLSYEMLTVLPDLPAWDPRWATVRPRVLQIRLNVEQRPAYSLNVPRGGVQGILAICTVSRPYSWGMTSLRCEFISCVTTICSWLAEGSLVQLQALSLIGSIANGDSRWG